MSRAGRDERYEWNNLPPSNQRNNEECGIIHSSLTGSCRQSFRSPIAQLRNVVFMPEWGFIKLLTMEKIILPLSLVLSHFLHIPWSTHGAAHRDSGEQPQRDGQECLRQVGLGWLCLCCSCHLPLANALAYLGRFVPQVHFHWHLHFWVIDKNTGERILHDRIHLPSRPVELAGFQCYCYGVSSTPLYFSRLQYTIELKYLAVLFFFFFFPPLKLYWKWENAEVH